MYRLSQAHLMPEASRSDELDAMTAMGSYNMCVRSLPGTATYGTRAD